MACFQRLLRWLAQFEVFLLFAVDLFQRRSGVRLVKRSWTVGWRLVEGWLKPLQRSQISFCTLHSLSLSLSVHPSSACGIYNLLPHAFLFAIDCFWHIDSNVNANQAIKEFEVIIPKVQKHRRMLKTIPFQECWSNFFPECQRQKKCFFATLIEMLTQQYRNSCGILFWFESWFNYRHKISKQSLLF